MYFTKKIIIIKVNNKKRGKNEGNSNFWSWLNFGTSQPILLLMTNYLHALGWMEQEREMEWDWK